MDIDLVDRIASAVASRGRRSSRAQTAADLIRNATTARWVGIYSVADTTVANEAWSGPAPPAHPVFLRTEGLTAHALRAGAPALSNDVARDPRYLANQGDSGSELIVPVLRDGEPVGTLDVESDQVGAFSGTDIEFYERLAGALVALWDIAPS